MKLYKQQGGADARLPADVPTNADLDRALVGFAKHV